MTGAAKKRRAEKPTRTKSAKGGGHLWSAETRARACEAIYERIKTGTPMVVAAALEGVPPRTWEDWRQKDPEVREASDLARLIGSETHREKLETELDMGGAAQEAKARMHWMGILYRDLYAPVEKREVSGPEGKPQEHTVAVRDATSEMSREELERAARALLTEKP